MAAHRLIREQKFDLDSGYLKKSPCRECPMKSRLPGCANNCPKLTRIQELLAGTISCSNHISEYETYSLSRPDF